MYTVQCIVYSVHCIVYTVQYTVPSMLRNDSISIADIDTFPEGFLVAVWSTW